MDRMRGRRSRTCRATGIFLLLLLEMVCGVAVGQDQARASRLAKNKKIVGRELGVPVPAAALVLNARLEEAHVETLDAVRRLRDIERRRLPRLARTEALSSLVEARRVFLQELLLMKSRVEADLKTTQGSRRELLDQILPVILEEKRQTLALEYLLDRLEEKPPLAYQLGDEFWQGMENPEISEEVRTLLESQAARVETGLENGSETDLLVLRRTLRRFVAQGNESVGELQTEVTMIQSLRQTDTGISMDLAPLLRDCLRSNLQQISLERQTLGIE